MWNHSLFQILKVNVKTEQLFDRYMNIMELHFIYGIVVLHFIYGIVVKLVSEKVIIKRPVRDAYLFSPRFD